MSQTHSLPHETFSCFGRICVLYGLIWTFFKVLKPKFDKEAVSDDFMAHSLVFWGRRKNFLFLRIPLYSSILPGAKMTEGRVAVGFHGDGGPGSGGGSVVAEPCESAGVLLLLSG